MGDSNRTQLYYVAETSWGIGAAGTKLSTLRFTGESFSYGLTTIKSQEIRSDRQTPDLILTDAEATGDANYELSFTTYDDFMKAALYASAWSTAVNVTSTQISAVASTNSYDSTAVNFVTSNIVAGQWIKVAGFTTTTNNGYAMISTVATNSIVVVAGLTLSDEPVSDSITMKGTMIRNGTTETSFAIERQHVDITQFFAFIGMVPNSFSLSASAGEIVTGTFGFMGKSCTLAAATTGDGSPTAATSTDVMNAVTNVGQVMEGSTLELLSGVYFQSLDFTLNNAIRPQKAIGSLGAVDLGVGAIDLTGTVNAYFTDNALYDKFLANTASALSMKFQDAAGNAYIFTFPKMKFSSDAINAGGIDQDVMENLGWTALRHPTYDCMIQVDKFAIA